MFFNKKRTKKQLLADRLRSLGWSAMLVWWSLEFIAFILDPEGTHVKEERKTQW